MSPAKRTKMDPEAAVAILVNKADIARAQIRGLVNSLPDSEAEAILAVLDDPPQDEEEAPTGFVWDKLPAEVKNMIYRFVFVSSIPVKPHIMWPNIPHKRHIVKHGLGANFLRCSKAIYAEAYPILRMENTFEIGTHFRVCLGEDRNNKNSDLIRNVFIRSPKLSWNILHDVERLQNLKELTVVSRMEWTTFGNQEDAERDAAFAFTRLDPRLKGAWGWRGKGAIITRVPKVYYLAEREIKVSTAPLSF